MPQQLKAQLQRLFATYSLEYACHTDMSQPDPDDQDPYKSLQDLASSCIQRDRKLYMFAYRKLVWVFLTKARGSNDTS